MGSNKVLLIDTVTATSPGARQIRDNLFPALARQCPEKWEVLMLVSPQSAIGSYSEKAVVQTCEHPGGSWIGRWKWYNDVLPERVRRHHASVLYSLSGILSKPLARACGTVCTVNNMLPFTPGQDGPFGLASKEGLRNRLLRIMYVRSLRAADAIILHSRYALEKMEPFTGDLRNKTIVVHTGVPSDLGYDSSCPPAHPYGGAPYLFYLSSIQRYKNHIRLIEAYRQLFIRGAALPDLILAGFPKDEECLGAIRKSIEDAGLADRIKYIGQLPRQDIPAWMHHATVTLFPSTCETNSVIMAEALAVGGVLAVSSCPPMPEIGGDAVALFDPLSPDDMAEVIGGLCLDKARQEQLRMRATERAKELSWDACAAAVWQLSTRADAAHVARTKSPAS